ncbi:MAG: hypothetical protein OXS29_18925 [bacterium]|nr:hypothetical protein [bacterium]MDE0288083.1 hypothetical protein [bacterium]MDE0439498.1 hypothetical protein [bacterium]
MERNLGAEGVVVDRAAVADLLTFSRLVSAPLLAWLVANRHVDMAVGLVGLAWCTDYFDGRFARAAARDTRLKRWDLRADSWVAVGLGLGLGFGGYVSWWTVAPVAAVVFVGSLVSHNPSVVMMGTGYLLGVFLWSATIHGTLRWLPAFYLTVALIASWRRFFGVVLPVWVRGLRLMARGERRRDSHLVLDEWLD